ncbi:hypothetical protein C7S18_18650 [Ahniella affigens]|uniref:MAPEG family protein n=1 Tax=Ahniella affigens TaxID=2021234 RepID=A0A2P1PZB5_9GAMM|nr:MAPEG family protein [Ahniella affigens]AVQ00184.1 hypothetical protein C7S18_18650 [Ahniella affigens]
MSAHSIFWPGFALAAITFVVWIRMYTDRVGEMKAKRIHPQKVASRVQAAQLLSNTKALDHYSNLFETPVLFYFTLVVIAVAKLDQSVLLPMAWAFVAARAIHAFIHVTYNKVWHRFYAFLISCIALWLFMAYAAWLLGQQA